MQVTKWDYLCISGCLFQPLPTAWLSPSLSYCDNQKCPLHISKCPMEPSHPGAPIPLSCDAAWGEFYGRPFAQAVLSDKETRVNRHILISSMLFYEDMTPGDCICLVCWGSQLQKRPLCGEERWESWYLMASDESLDQPILDFPCVK